MKLIFHAVIIFSVFFLTHRPVAAAAAAIPDTMSADMQAANDLNQMKDLLVKLVKQDETLDEAIETFSPAAKPDFEDIEAAILSVKALKANISEINAEAKTKFSTIKPGIKTSAIARAIASYSKRIDKKTSVIESLVGRRTARSRSGMRDAVSSKKGKSASPKGRRLDEIMLENKALKKLSAELRSLKNSSKSLAASSKWLYIVSR